MKEANIYSKLAKIQQELQAPKNQFNEFGNYSYRSQEDILEAVKPLLGDLILTLTDEAIILGNRFYIKAVAKITDGKESIETTAYAREPEIKKKMDQSQISGSASSYARKYALNGLFLIDDNKDADTQNNTETKKIEKKPSDLDVQIAYNDIKRTIKNAMEVSDLDKVKAKMIENKGLLSKEQFAELVELAKKKKADLEDIFSIIIDELNEQ